MFIGELATRAGTTPRALRYYEEAGLLEPERRANGYRAYSDDAVLRVRQIRSLIEAGFGTDIIAKLLPCATGPRPHIQLCPQVAAEMNAVLARIDSDISTLSSQRSAVAGLLNG